MFIKNTLFLLTLSASTIGCKTSFDSLSNTEGASSLISRIKVEPKRLTILHQAAKHLDTAMTRETFTGKNLAPQDALKKILAEEIVSAGGIPRWQIRHILTSFLKRSETACGGGDCAIVFGIKDNDTESFLDAFHRSIETSLPASALSPDKKNIKDLLLVSLQRDYELPIKLSSSDVVKLRNPLIEDAVRVALRKEGNAFTREDLKGVQTLTLSLFKNDIAGNTRADLQDLLQFPELSSVHVTTDHVDTLQQLAKFGDNLKALTIRWVPQQAYVARTSDFEIFGSLPALTKVKMIGVSLADADLLPGSLPQIKHLIVDKPSTPLTDTVLSGIGRMSQLEKLTFEDISYQQIKGLSAVMPRSLKDIEVAYSGRSAGGLKKRLDDCGDLSGFRLFANASTMQIVGCQIGAMSGFGRPMGWQILSLRRCTAPGTATLKLNPSDELSELLVVNISDSTNLELMDEAKKELTVRLAKSQKTTPR